VSDPYSFTVDSDPAAPSDAQRRRVLFQQLRLAANAVPGQTASALAPPSVPNAEPPVTAPPVQPSMLQALREANAAPSAAAPTVLPPTQQAAPQIDVTPDQPAAGGIADRMRAYLHNQIDRTMDASTEGFDQDGKPPAWIQRMMSANRVGLSSVPGPQSDLAIAALDSIADKQSVRDTLHAGVDAALDRASRADIIKGVARGAQQGLSGFNEGLGDVVLAPVDALDRGAGYVTGKLAAAFGAAPPPASTSLHDAYNKTFVAPAGPPQTKTEQQIRGATRSFGSDLPAFLLAGGLASAGARSGVTLAEQEAPGLLEKVREPTTKAANYVGDKVGFIASKLQEMVPNFINALHPTNIANAARASNVQGAADTALQRVAARPGVVAYGDLARDWRNEKRRLAQEGTQQAP
jgi:hypothetical protein